MTATVQLDAVQQSAVDHSLDAALTAIVGPAGTGKSLTLMQRAARAVEALRAGQSLVLAAPSTWGVARLRETSGTLAADQHVVCMSLGEIAFEILQGARGGDDGGVSLIEDERAAEIFAGAGAELFALEWTEFVSAEIDPEIAGMRWPDRFADAALRLIRKLRAADLSPDEFVKAGRAGANQFYSNPPNLSGLELIEHTAQRYRDSLVVSASELERQRRREIDLMRIIERLYRLYLDALVARGCLTRVDALIEAAHLLERRPELRAECTSRLPFCFIDDAQDLGVAEAAFLQALYGERMEGVTLAGDAEQRTLGFATPRAEGMLARAATTFTLQEGYRPAPVIECLRAEDIDEEAALVARRVAAAIGEGVPAARIAVITRRLTCIGPFVDALLNRNVAIDLAGEAPFFEFGVVSDALAALWALADPYRHDWLLRNLEAPWLNLSDATIATLCGEPAEPQILLFEPPEDTEDDRGRRWDRRRNLRLARNVVRGERDADLPAVARERLAAFRAARARWALLERSASLETLARTIFAETVLAAPQRDARARFRAGLVERLARDIDRFAGREPWATLHDFLLHAERRAASDELAALEALDHDAVAIRAVEAAKGYEYDRVFVVEARAGAFPRYYVPEAFLFSPKYGMIPKENVGAAAAATRTAKFTYYQHRLALRDRYNAEERRAFGVAMTRARVRVVASASGRPTRGRGTPEFLEELRATGCNGSVTAL